MKNISLLLLFLCSALLLPAQSGPSQAWSGDLALLFEGFVVDEERLSHEAFCLSNKDTLVIRYQPVSGEDGQFVLLGCEIWGQVSLGEPTLLGQVPIGKPGNPAELALPLATFVPAHLIPDGGKAVRIMLRVRRIIEVDGSRYLGHIDVPEAATDFTFLMTRSCE